MPGLGASFGRGAATNYEQDMANSDCILFMGTNTAEAHPVAFRWPMKAKEKGASLIHVDPRFTRTSAHCDVYVGIRAGTDVAFLGGLINYVLSNGRWFREYVLNYTNASTIIQDGFRDTEDLAGLFSGYHGDGQTGKYDAWEGHWGYEGCPSGDGEPHPPRMLKEESGIHGHDLTLGTGSYDGIFGGQASLRYKNFFAEANGQFTLRGDGAHSYHFANDVTWNAGPGYYLVRKPHTVVGCQCAVSGESKDVDRFQGRAAEDTGVTSVFIGPRIVAAHDQISGELAAELPVLMNTTALQVVPDYRLHASFAVSW